MIRHGLFLAIVVLAAVPSQAQVPEVGHTCVSGCGGQSSSNPAQDARRARAHAEHMKRQREWDGILRRWQAAARKGAGYSRQGQKELAKGRCAQAMSSFQSELAAFQSVSSADLYRADNIWGLNKCIREGGKTYCYGDMQGAQDQRVGWARERIAGAQSQCARQSQSLIADNHAGAPPTSSKAKKSKSKSNSQTAGTNAKSNSPGLSHAQSEQQKRDARLREWSDRGRAAEARNDWRDAIRDYKKASESSPGDPGAQQNLARAQSQYAADAYKKGDYKNAIKYYGEAAKTSPNDTTIAANLRAAEDARSRGKAPSRNAAIVQPSAGANIQPATGTAAQPAIVTPVQPAAGANPQPAAAASVRPASETTGQLSPFPASGAPSAPSNVAPAPAFEVKPNGSAMQQLQAIAGAPKQAPDTVQGVCRENCLPPRLLTNQEALGKYKEMEVRRAQKQQEYQSLGDKLDQINRDMHAGNGNQAELARQFSVISNRRTTVHTDLAATETQMNSFLVSFQEEPAKSNGEPEKKGTTADQPK